MQPLTRQQVEHYLDTSSDTGADALRTALEADDSLWELVDSPLMLDIMALAYQGNTADALPTTGTVEERQARLCEAYAEQMFARQPVTGRRYTQAQANHWLSWLARSLSGRAQSEFHLDHLQPDWLPTVVQRCLVAIVPAVASGLVGGLLVGLAAGLVFMLVAVNGGRAYEPAGRLRWPWLGLGGGLGVGLGVGLFAGPVFGLVAGLIAMAGGRAYELVRSRESKFVRATINPVEELHWSWSGLLSELSAGLRVGLGYGLRGGLSAGAHH